MAYDDNPGDQTAPWINYVLVPSTFADAGDTGLTTGKDYICLRVDDLDALTEAQANATTGSVKQIIYAIMDQFHTWRDALATADAPAKLTMRQMASGSATTGTNTDIRHELVTEHGTDSDVAAE